MPVYKYKVVAESTSNVEWARITLEGQQVYLRPNSAKKKFTSKERDIEVDRKLSVFCKCKGDTGIKVEYTITNVPNNDEILTKKGVIIGDDSDEAPRIGKWSKDIDPV